MSNKTVYIDLAGRLDKYEKSLSDAESKTKKATQRMESSFSKIAKAAIFAVATKETLEFAKEAVELAGKLQGVRAAFNQLNQPNLLAELRTATRGTVDDLTLMQRAVQANNFKIPLSQMGTLLEFAQKRATQTGESVDYLVDSIITGIGRKSPLILDNLGISAAALSEEVKRVGDFGKAAGNIVEQELTKMGDVSLTTTDRVARMNATFMNMKVALGEQLVPVVDIFIDGLVGIVSEGDRVENSISGITGTVKILASGLLTAVAAFKMAYIHADAFTRAVSALGKGDHGIAFAEMAAANVRTQNALSKLKTTLDDLFNGGFYDKVLADYEASTLNTNKKVTNSFKDAANKIQQAIESGNIPSEGNNSKLTTTQTLYGTGNDANIERLNNNAMQGEPKKDNGQLQPYYDMLESGGPFKEGNGFVNGVETSMAAADGFVSGFFQNMTVQGEWANSMLEQAFAGLADAIIGQIQRMLAEWLSFMAVRAAFGFLGIPIPGAAEGGNFVGTNNGVMKMANGGSFTVPAGYNNDSFPMMVQSGERVSVTPAGKVGGSEKLLSQMLSRLDALNMNLVNKDMSVKVINNSPDVRTKIQSQEKIKKYMRKENTIE